MRWSVVVVSLLVCKVAVGKPYSVLTDAKRTWTYDVVEGEAGKPTGQQVTLEVATREQRGAYTLLVVETKGEGELADLTRLSLLVGPGGVRETLNIDPKDYKAKAFRDYFEHKYLPRVYLPAALKKQRFKRSLDRFGEDDRIYSVTGALTKRDAHTWRMAWTGSYVVPEEQGPDGDDGTGGTKYAAVVEFDPAAGFTLICPLSDEKRCLRLRP